MDAAVFNLRFTIYALSVAGKVLVIRKMSRIRGKAGHELFGIFYFICCGAVTKRSWFAKPRSYQRVGANRNRKS